VHWNWTDAYTEKSKTRAAILHVSVDANSIESGKKEQKKIIY
jgi:hypothetical protein